MIITWRKRIITAAIFLVFLAALIEGTGYLYAFGRIQHGARWGVRYAVAVAWNPQYCEDAAATLNLLEADLADGTVDCNVTLDYCRGERLSRCGEQPSSAKEGAEYLTNRLTDWARLPSIWDEALLGSTGVDIDSQASGDYVAYLKTHDKRWLGDASVPGYLHVTVCSRPNITSEESKFRLLWDDGLPLCFNNAEKVFMDDAGEELERVTVVVVYTYTPVIPWLRWIWPTIPMVVSREGIVEGFRPGTVYGFGELIPGAETAPTPTRPPAPTPIPTITPLPKGWLEASQPRSARLSSLSFLVTVVLLIVGIGGFYLGKMIDAFLKLRRG
ncbi:MAG: hypothetical protein ACOYYS_10780 [Chloroflexota bacterium]